MEINITELVDVLTQGNKLIMELESHLDRPFPSPEACKVLLSQVQTALATAIAMTRFLEQGKLVPPLPAAVAVSDSPRSYCSERTYKEQERRERYKKRKTLPRWSGQLRASSGSAMEGPIGDGHSWRKYGQKDILGAKFPRGYFRCTYSNSHGCVATKQVQRSGDDPSVFDVTYRGDHTCNHGLESTPLLFPNNQSLPQSQQALVEEQPQKQQQLLEIFKTGLRVKTEGLGSESRPIEYSPSFSFPSMPANMLPCASMAENFVGCDSEVSDIFSATTSTTSSPMVGIDLGWEQLFFEGKIPFDFC